jgi:hypothetical protein
LWFERDLVAAPLRLSVFTKSLTRRAKQAHDVIMAAWRKRSRAASARPTKLSRLGAARSRQSIFISSFCYTQRPAFGTRFQAQGPLDFAHGMQFGNIGWVNGGTDAGLLRTQPNG